MKSDQEHNLFHDLIFMCSFVL